MKPHPLSLLIAATFAAVCGCASPPQQSTAAGDDVSRIEKLREEQFQLLAQVRYELALLEPIVNASRVSDEHTAKFRERYEALRREFRTIEDEVQSSESGSTVYVSARAEDPRIAEYYDRLRARIEKAGTSSFPKVDGKPIYGTASVLVSMHSTGEVTSVDVAESSSYEVRNHVKSLIHGLSPLEPLPGTVSQGARRVLLVAVFNYTAKK